MWNRIGVFGSVVVVVLLATLTAEAADYRIAGGGAEVTPGTITHLTAEVETKAGDNVVGIGFFSFAIDLGLSGSAGARGTDISSIVLNTTNFDDLLSGSVGAPQGDRYLGIAGLTTDLIAPTFGYNTGDVTRLFDFSLTVPASALMGETIIITPSGGALENLIANTTFDSVRPQNFAPLTLVVVPEPTTASLLLAFLALGSSVVWKRR
jgi:hypothetical protein